MFIPSDKLSRFLRFIVEATLAGEADIYITGISRREALA
jgi:hypothetical protein